MKAIREQLFTTPLADLKKTKNEYEKKCPGPLSKIFPDKLPKEEAVLRHEERRNFQTELQPPGELKKNMMLLVTLFSLKTQYFRAE